MRGIVGRLKFHAVAFQNECCAHHSPDLKVVGERGGSACMHKRVDIVLVEKALGPEGGLDLARADHGGDDRLGL
jgi:hypothetical protein